MRHAVLIVILALSSTSGCTDNAQCPSRQFCSTVSGCTKCFADWTNSEIDSCCAGDDYSVFRSMSCAMHLDGASEAASAANCNVRCENTAADSGGAATSDAQTSCAAWGSTEDYCTIVGLGCHPEHQDADVGAIYAGIDASDRWYYRGTTSDGRPRFENTAVSDQMRYLYHSPRANGYLLTATAPSFTQAEPWGGGTGSNGNNQVRFNSGSANDPSGVHSGSSNGARLYCGHDTGAAAPGCSSHPRGDGQMYYWCDNNGPVTVTCTGYQEVLCASNSLQSTGLASVVGTVAGGGGLILIIVITIVVCTLHVRRRHGQEETAGGVPLQDLGRPRPSQTSPIPVAQARVVPMGGLPVAGERFDVTTGQPIPKFDPNTGRQNWWDAGEGPGVQHVRPPIAQAVPVGNWWPGDNGSYGKSVV